MAYIRRSVSAGNATVPSLRDGFRLGEWLVEPSLNRVSSRSVTRPLEPKIMDVLVYLAERAGKVATRQELIDAIWARRFVDESVLSRAVAQIRSALGDSSRKPRFLETISRRGYRLVAPVVVARKRAPAADGVRQAFLVAIGEDEIGLVEGENLIGRGEEARVRLEHEKVSRRHAKIIVRGDRAVLEDLGSKNGTWLNGKRVSTPAQLADGNEIIIGPVTLVFRSCLSLRSTLTDRNEPPRD
jgi:DNA-binding winged helix-turn-helix (wHTH) protein